MQTTDWSLDLPLTAARGQIRGGSGLRILRAETAFPSSIELEMLSGSLSELHSTCMYVPLKMVPQSYRPIISIHSES